MSKSEKIDVTDLKNKWFWLAIVLVIIASAVIRGRLVSMPLERDEGEYAYIGQQMLKGVPPYISAYSMKLPGIYAVYAVIMTVFGQTPTGIHWGLIVFNCAAIFVIFLLTKKMFGGLAGAAAGCAYAILSLLSSALGLTANAEHFVLLPALIGCLILIRAVERDSKFNVFISAIFFGLAFITKQHGILFAVFGALYLLCKDLFSRPIKWKKLISNQLIFAYGVIIPFILICFLYWRMGVFDKFWFWTFTYAGKYASAVPLEVGWWLLKEKITEIVPAAVLIWLLAVIGLISVFIHKAQRKNLFFVIGFLIFSFLAVCPGLYFRGHYFLFFFPAAAICAGVGFYWFCQFIAFVSHRISTYIKWPAVAAVGVIISGVSIYQQKTYLFEMSTTQICRMFYDGNPFPEAIEIGKYIKDRSTPNDKIAIVGSEPEIFFYADRLSATPYIYTYPLMETHQFAQQMQSQMIGEIEAAKPEWLVFIHVQMSWLMRPQSNLYILSWSSEYAKKFYTVEGIIEIPPDWQTVTIWGNKAVESNPTTENWVGVYKRKH